MKRSIEQFIMAAAEPGSANNAFTERVMASVKKQSSTEIFSSAIRTTSVNKKETFIMKLQHLPNLAVVAITAAALLTVTGAAYAISALWPKPSVETSMPAKNQFNRTEISASFKACGGQQEQASYEIKQGSTLDPAEVEKILQARCEQAAIQQWVLSSLPQPSRERVKEGDVREEYRLSGVASKVDVLSKTQVSLSGDVYNSPKEPLTLTQDTKFIVDGKEASAGDIKTGDNVMFIQFEKTQYNLNVISPTNTRVEGKLLESKVSHIIKVNLPIEYYGPSKQNQIAKREPCLGNPQDTCVQSAMIDLYFDKNGSPVDANKMEYRHIQDIIESHKGGTIKFKTSSGRTFSVQLPSDVIAEFNGNRSASYNNIKVGTGDTLSIRYYEAKNEHSTTLHTKHLHKSVDLLLDLIQKGDLLKKY